MKKKTIINSILAAFIVLFVSFNAYAYQFEDYEWGSYLNDVVDILKERGKSVQFNSESTIQYEDRLHHNDCIVSFVFTPKTKELAEVVVETINSDIFSYLYRLFIEKYGYPKEDKMFAEYIWKDPNSLSYILISDNDVITKIYYKNGDYFYHDESKGYEVWKKKYK